MHASRRATALTGQTHGVGGKRLRRDDSSTRVDESPAAAFHSNEPMKVALFIPCFIDAFYPEVGIATLELLERFGIEVDYPQEQTCCGQPMANSGAHVEAAGAEGVFARNFAGYDYIVGPSASCINHVRDHLTAIEQSAAVTKVRASAFELVEFLHDVVGAREFPWAGF